MDNEFEGVELAEVIVRQEKCQHDWKERIVDGYTQDARRKKVRIRECPKCGARIEETIWEEEVSEEAIWR